MAIEVNVTDFGKALLVKALNNTCPILFTHMKFGNGPSPSDYSEMVDLVNPLLSRPISDITKGDNYVQLTSEFSNSDVDTSFSLTEIGVFAMDQDGVTATPAVSGSGISAATVDNLKFMTQVSGVAGVYLFSYDGSEWSLGGNEVDIADYGISVTGTAASGDTITVTVTVGASNLGTHLFAYVNQSSDPEPVYGANSNKLKENAISVVVIVDDAENVTAVVKALSYVTTAQLEEHTANTLNPHHVTAQQIGLGNVDNVSTNDQKPAFSRAGTLSDIVSGETMSALMGKIAKAVNSLISHLGNKNNPHSVTAEQAGAAKSDHNHSASDINSGTLGVGRGGTGISSAPSMLTDLGSTTAVSPFQSAPRPGVTGTLPESKGGTGVTSLTGTDYSASRVRGIAISSSVPASIPNGRIVCVYH